MNEHEKWRQEKLRQSWIESLLVSATKPVSHADRIDRAMKQIETKQVVPISAEPARSGKRFIQWVAIGMAAAVLLAFFLLIPREGTASALATIQRSLNVAAEQTTRKYLLQIESVHFNNRIRKIDVDLYVQGSERFALRHPGLLPGSSFWLGRDGSEAWFVPPIGPVLKGNQAMLKLWIPNRQKLDLPYLHITTILKRMSRGYRLESLEDEEIAIPVGSPSTCQHIRAQRKTSESPKHPKTIELWANRDSGMAVRLFARWELKDGAVGKKSVELTFQNEEPSLAKDWFTAEGHYEGFRPIRLMKSADN